MTSGAVEVARVELAHDVSHAVIVWHSWLLIATGPEPAVKVEPGDVDHGEVLLAVETVAAAHGDELEAGALARL